MSCSYVRGFAGEMGDFGRETSETNESLRHEAANSTYVYLMATLDPGMCGSVGTWLSTNIHSVGNAGARWTWVV